MYLARNRTQPGCDCSARIKVLEIHIGVMDTLKKMR
jgi:hypothetical protein